MFWPSFIEPHKLVRLKAKREYFYNAITNIVTEKDWHMEFNIELQDYKQQVQFIPNSNMCVKLCCVFAILPSSGLEM